MTENDQDLSQQLQEWQRHTRSLQVKAIAEQFEAVTAAEYTISLPIQKIAYLLYLHDIGGKIDVQISLDIFGKIDRDLLKGFSEAGRLAYVYGKLHALNNAVSEDITWRREITLTEPDYVSGRKMLEAVGLESPELLGACEQGRKLGVSAFLDLLARDDIPLLEYKSSAISGIGASASTLDGGLMYALPTKIPCVNVKYSYPPAQNDPAISVVVDTFEM